MTHLRSLLLASTLLAACQGAPPPDAAAVPIAGPERMPMTASVRVRDANAAAGPFRLGELDRLDVQIELLAAPEGAHDFRLDVVAPDGTLYAQLPVTAEANAAGQASLTQPLEVRGTPIDLLHITGAWSFRLAQVDGEQPLARAEAEVGE